MGMDMWIIWLIIAVVALIIEAATTGLTTVWCALGALVAMVLDLCGVPVMAQVGVMAVVTIACFIICMIWIKPKFDKSTSGKAEPTNADRLIGMTGVVIKTIDPDEGKGQVKVEGQIWSARADGTIEEGAKVKVTGIAGVKLQVEKA